MRISVFAVLVASGSASLPAQATSPSAIARAYFDAIVIQNWNAAATLLRTDDVERIRRDAIASFRPRESRTFTADDFLRHDSAMPRAVAQYQADQANKRVKELPDLGGLQFAFADVKDTAQLAALSAVEVGARWIEARDLRYQMRRMLASSPECPREMYSAAAASMVPRFEVLGEVVRTDTAWVLYRNVEQTADIPAQYIPPPSLKLLFRDPSGWRIAPRDELGGFTAVGLTFSSVRCEARTPRD